MITLTMVVFGLVKAGKERKEWVSGASRPTWHLASGIISDLGQTMVQLFQEQIIWAIFIF